MSTVFVGGSRHISTLPTLVLERLGSMIQNACRIIVGDANGADKAVQMFFHSARYKDVTIFCSGMKPRNNIGDWQIHPVSAAKSAKGFQFYAAKDREMAFAADVGYMIWDGKSPGTVLNVLRLVGAGKIALLVDVRHGETHKFKALDDWNAFLKLCDREFIDDLKDRATPDEWEPRLKVQTNLLTQTVAAEPVPLFRS